MPREILNVCVIVRCDIAKTAHGSQGFVVVRFNRHKTLPARASKALILVSPLNLQSERSSSRRLGSQQRS